MRDVQTFAVHVSDLPKEASDQAVRTVTENSRTLKFDTQGFERE